MRLLAYIAIGALFGTGLVVSEMTKPARVLGFLDFGGDFDPSLLFVIGGAVLVHAVTYRLVLARSSPLWAPSFSSLASQGIDARLLLGSAVFGVGWGLAGYCPGPALVSLFTFSGTALAFVLGMIFGMLLFARFSARSDSSNRAPTSALMVDS